MSQHDFDVANQAFAALRADVNLALQALASQSGGNSAPSPMYPGQPWRDTTNNLLKRGNAAGNAWIPEDTLDETRVVSRASNTVLGVSDLKKFFKATAAFTQTLTAAATLGEYWHCFYNANGYSIVFDPNGSETIDGATTKTVTGSGIIVCSGSDFFTIGFPVVSSSLPRSYLAGGGMANGTDATNDIDFAAVSARDSTNAADISAAALTKQLDAAWAAGTGAGGRDTGSIANGTWHCFAIKKDSDGSGDFLFSLSATAPTMPSGYTFFRRIGAILRESGAIVAFSQNGDHFLRVTPVVDVNANNPGTSSVTRTMSVPTGVVVDLVAQWSFSANSTGTNNCLYVRPLVVTDGSPSAGTSPVGTIVQAGGDSGRHNNPTAQLITRTNTSAQIATRNNVSSASETIYGMTIGWIDRRGREA